MAETSSTDVTNIEENKALAEEWPETVDLVVNLPSKASIFLPSVSSAETLNALRQALADFQETAFITAFKWSVVKFEDGEGNTIASDPVDCNDYTEISALLKPQVRKVVLEVVPDSYDVKKVRLHVKRLRDTINRPYLVAASPKDENSPATDAEEETTVTKKKSDNALPKVESLLESAQLGNYFNESFQVSGKDFPQSIQKPTLTSAIKGVFLSGWNPAPAARRIQGDLAYVEVTLGTEGTIYVTATARGFYLNKSNRSQFDPRPASNSHFSHDLFTTLYEYSANLRAAWTTYCEKSNTWNATSTAGPLDSVATVYAQFNNDLTTLPPAAWVAPKVSTDASTYHSLPQTYDMLRVQEDVGDLHGTEELGAPREWNDEIQSIRSLKAEDLSEKIVKARLEHRIITEFTDSCKKIAVAINEGLIAPLTYSDPNQSDIYVYNGIFFSRAEDTRDAFKISEGEEAARKTTSRDMINQKIVRSFDVDGLGSVLCAIVDYKGIRYVGQSIIPGIFNQGDNCAQLSYGVLEVNKPLTVKNASLAVFEELRKRLFLAKRDVPLLPFKMDEDAATPVTPEPEDDRNDDPLTKLLKAADNNQSSPIKVDEVDNVEVNATNNSVPHIGPIESKLIKGSDGRSYALELMRLTPRDGNYVVGEKGTQKIVAEELAKADASLNSTYLLRQELIQIFIQRKLNLARQNLLLEAAGKEKALLQKKQDDSATTTSTTSTDATATTTDEEDHEEGEKVQIVKEEKAKDELVVDEALQNELANEYAERFRAITPESLGLEINPNVFIDNLDIGEFAKEQIQKDEELVREISTFLVESVLQMVTRQIREGEFYPRELDGMVNFLHRMGVNLRYLGQLATLATEQEREDAEYLMQGKQRVHSMPYYWLEFLIIEMLARVSKHLINQTLRQDLFVASSPAASVASLLNHILSIFEDTVVPEEPKTTKALTATADNQDDDKKSKKKKGKKGGNAVVKVGIPVDNVTEYVVPNAFASRETTLAAVEDLLMKRFLYEFPLLSKKVDFKDKEDLSNEVLTSQALSNAMLRTRLSPVVLVRRICQQCGIVIAAKDYDFKKGNAFTSDDILGLIPRVKSCEPETYLPEFTDMLNTSATFLQQGNPVAAFECAQQAMGIATQITGPNHVQAFQAADQMTAVLISSADIRSATSMASRSLALSSQVQGLDCQDSILHHIQLGALYTELGHIPEAIGHLQTARYFLHIVGGDHHPELVNIFVRFAALYEKVNDFDSACQCLLRARVYTNDLLKSCMLTISVANLFYRQGRVHEAVATQKNGYKILKELVTETDERLVEVKKNLEVYIRASVGVPLPSSAMPPLSQQGMIEDASTPPAGPGTPILLDDTTTTEEKKKRKNHHKKKGTAVKK